MSVSVYDSRLFRDLFGTQEIRDVFSDEAYVRRLIETEAALARAQSRVGVIPVQAGEVITTAFADIHVNFDKLSKDTEIVGYPVLPLVWQLVESTPSEMAKYIHWGATTQDIMDTAVVLQLRSGLTVIRRELDTLVAVLSDLAARYRDTPMAGRTHLQHALPCTFGYKCAVYLSSILRHRERIRDLEQRGLLVQFGGAAGTLASLGHSGLLVRQELARELSLIDAPITWHVTRDNISEMLNFLALLGGSLGKIAFDVMLMSSNELGEVSEPFVPHRGASSTMPQKRNPISSEIILAASKVLRSNAGLGLDATVMDFERASGPWHLEWFAIPESFVLTVGSLHQMNLMLRGLVVNVGAMEKNLRSTKGLIVGEAVMMKVATSIGRQKAHDVVYEACQKATEEGTSLFEALRTNSTLMSSFEESEIAKACDPLNYLGSSQCMVDQVLERVKMESGRS